MNDDVDFVVVFIALITAAAASLVAFNAYYAGGPP